MGPVNFYRRFIAHAAEHLPLITDLLRGNPRKIVLMDEARVAFSEVTSVLVKTTRLTHPTQFATQSSGSCLRLCYRSGPAIVVFRHL